MSLMDKISSGGKEALRAGPPCVPEKPLALS